MFINPQKFFSTCTVALTLTLSMPSFADKYNDSNPQPTAARHTDDASITDEVPTAQSSTLPANCVMTKKRGEICGAKAAKWCGKHSGSKECRHFKASRSASSDTDTDKTP